MVESSQTFSKPKILFLGENSVGKTSLIYKYVYDIFNLSLKPTQHIDNLNKTVSINNKALSLNLISLNGHDRFKSISLDYIKICSVAVVVFEITNKQSFECAKNWGEVVKSEKPGCKLVLVGNKIDKAFLRVVSIQEALDFSENIGAGYVETSAYTGENVKEMFRMIFKVLSIERKQFS